MMLYGMSFVSQNAVLLNTLRPRRNEQHFADDIFKSIFFNENIWISTKIPLKFVPKGPINNIPALIPIMAWRRLGGKPLSEPMMVSLPTHISATQPQWVKSWQCFIEYHIDELVQERRNSRMLPMELCLSCTNPLISLLNCDIADLHYTSIHDVISI